MNKIEYFWPTLKRLLSYGASYRKSLLLAVFILWIAAAAEVIAPMLISYFIDHIITNGYLSLKLVIGLVLIYIILQLLATILHYFQTLLFNKTALGVVQRLRIEVMDVTLHQPLNIFDNQPVGQIISRVTNDTEIIKDLYVIVISNIIKSTALIGSMLLAMFSLDWRMALISIAIFPAVLAVMIIYQYYSTPVVRLIRAHLATINDSFNEVIGGMTIIQQFRQQTRFAKRIAVISNEHYLARIRMLHLESFLLRPLLNLFSALVLCSLLLLFSFSLPGSVGVGVFYAFISYLSRLHEPLIGLTAQQSIMQQAVVAGERIFNLMDQVQQSYGTDDSLMTGGSIQMNNVTFAYHSDKKVLSNISFFVPSHGFIALAGHTGSGKSTLANLLMGYYPLLQGEILLDNRPLVKLSHRVLRTGIALVAQDPVILADSFFANIALGRNISEQQVWEVLEVVQLAHKVRKLPQKLYAQLGEKGNSLSVGEKQLLALARTLVQVPQILILDEATANIDSDTEQAIQYALQLIRQKTTLVVIAHRLSTIIDADNILVLHHGITVEQGKHQQLLAQQGRYYKMYQLQLVGKDLVTLDHKKSIVNF
ncbi:SmdB family multidrug efflux ABC transporter permease/ATP-binding protein [Candidatus Fukatsuia anoeciicola]|uniref:SmdB family multidrug efflux ABC transporter permease/ATP-binding protein n=1 Tax=Candidatus Fukatsuia anoeciicola TaxID=2994492 RepID=UPI003463FC23